MLVTGKTNKKPILEAFHVNAPNRKVLGLCSDAMSEGVNLQKASALVLLNMPSVMRVAEQRIGRIDRMNSPYEEIHLYWPEDHDAFTLKTDEKFFKTAQVVDGLLGGNIDIPEELTGKLNIQPIKGSTALKYYQQAASAGNDYFADSVQDAFLPVKELVSGSKSIVPPAVYEEMKNVTAKVVSFVSVVRSTSDWAFFSIKGIEGQAPQWLLINEKKEIIRDLPAICKQLREKLAEVQDVENINEKMQETIDSFVNLISGAERSLMPHKKRRALDLLEEVLQHYLKHCGKDRERYMVIQELLKYLAKSPYEAIDYQQFALEWIDIIRERYADLKSQKSNRRTVLHFRSRAVLKEFKEHPVSTDDLIQLRDSLSSIQPLHDRIGACIVGVGEY